jgi:hypothetical protein
VARPKNENRDLLIYFHVCYLRRKSREADGEPMSFNQCYEDVRKRLEEKGKISSNGTCLTLAAIRPGYANGEKIAAKHAKRFRLPSSLTEEERGRQIERLLILEMSSIVVLAEFQLSTLRDFDRELLVWSKDRMLHLLEEHTRSKKTTS